MHICSCHGIPGVLLSCGRGLPHGVQDLRWFETVLNNRCERDIRIHLHYFASNGEMNQLIYVFGMPHFSTLQGDTCCVREY